MNHHESTKKQNLEPVILQVCVVSTANEQSVGSRAEARKIAKKAENQLPGLLEEPQMLKFVTHHGGARASTIRSKEVGLQSKAKLRVDK